MENNLIIDGQICIYGAIGGGFYDDVGVSVSDVARALAELGSGPVTVRINSGGGIALDGVAIYSLLMAHRGEITTIVDGMAASAASLIFMAGSTRLMRDGAMLMIHDVGGVTFGNAADHAKSGNILDKLSVQYADIYASRSGADPAIVRAAMQAETWMDSSEAMAGGYATGEIEDDATPIAYAAFDYSQFARAPANVMLASVKPQSPHTRARAAGRGNSPPTPAAPSGDTKMDPVIIANPVPTVPPAPVKDWAIAFYATADRAGLTLAQTNDIVQASATLEAAKDALIEHRFTAQAALPTRAGGHVDVTRDGKVKMMDGMTAAVLGRAGMVASDRGNEFHGYGPMDIVRHILAINNLRVGTDPRRMVAAAITQTSSDFANIVSNIANKSMLIGYDEFVETFQTWTGVGDLPDFKTARKIDLNAIASLPPKLEGQEYQQLNTGDRGELYAVTTVGGMFNLTREVIINDDLDVFVRLPQKMGRAAKRTIGDAVYGALTGLSVMSDGKNLFDPAHNNVATGAASALSTASLTAARLAMRTQKDRSNPKAVLAISPKYLITPAVLYPTALQLLRSTAAIGQPNPGVTNTVQNIVSEVIEEPRLDAASATGWYLAADQKVSDTIDVVYMRGQQEPILEMQENFDADGITWKTRLDFGVKAFAWETLYKAAGA